MPVDPFVETCAGDCLLCGGSEALPPFSSTTGAATNESGPPGGAARRGCPRKVELMRRNAPRPLGTSRIDRDLRCSSTWGSAAAGLGARAAAAAAGAVAGAAASTAASEADAGVLAAAGTAEGAAARLVGSLVRPGYCGCGGSASGSSWLLLTAKIRGDGANAVLLASARGADALAWALRVRFWPGRDRMMVTRAGYSHGFS